MTAKTATDIVPNVPVQSSLSQAEQVLYENFKILLDLLKNGTAITGTFTSADGKTITVTNGIISHIV